MSTIEKLILASASPRRAVLVKKLGIPFEIKVPTCEEISDPRLPVAVQCELDPKFRTSMLDHEIEKNGAEKWDNQNESLQQILKREWH